MVDISDKIDNIREAIAEGYIKVSDECIYAIKENLVKKGDVLSIAEFAGIMAAKRTSELIPLCHQLNLTKVELKTEMLNDKIKISAYTKCIGQTGVEMEALTAVSIALLTIYDMCKAIDKNMIISDIKLIHKQKS